MQLILTELISAILQVIAFTLVPFLFFLFQKNKAVTFPVYMGLTRPTAKSIGYAAFVSVLFVMAGVGLAFISEGYRETLLLPDTVTGKMRLMGLNGVSVAVLLITALIKTSLSEELFFRGFLAKRLIHKLGFKTGNLAQALVFGLVHLVLFWALKTALLPLVILFLFSSFAGWSIGYIKEKYGRGSIVPGWVAHGLGNTLSYFVIAFVI